MQSPCRALTAGSINRYGWSLRLSRQETQSAAQTKSPACYYFALFMPLHSADANVPIPLYCCSVVRVMLLRHECRAAVTVYCSYLIHQLVSAAASLAPHCLLSSFLQPAARVLIFFFFSSPSPLHSSVRFLPGYTHYYTRTASLNAAEESQAHPHPPLSIYPSFKRSRTLLLGPLSSLLIHVLLDYSRLPLRACYTVRNVFSYKTRSIRMSPFGGKGTTRTLYCCTTLHYITSFI